MAVQVHGVIRTELMDSLLFLSAHHLADAVAGPVRGASDYTPFVGACTTLAGVVATQLIACYGERTEFIGQSGCRYEVRLDSNSAWTLAMYVSGEVPMRATLLNGRFPEVGFRLYASFLADLTQALQTI